MNKQTRTQQKQGKQKSKIRRRTTQQLNPQNNNKSQSNKRTTTYTLNEMDHVLTKKTNTNPQKPTNKKN